MEDKFKTILIIEDDDGLLEILREIIEELGHSVVGIQSAAKAVEWLSANEPYLMVLDYSLPDSSGSELINLLKDKEIEVPPFIVSTGHGDEHIAVEMMKLGARDYIVKDSTFINRISLVVDRVCKEIDKEKKLYEAEKAIVEAHQFGLQIIQNVQEGIVVYDLDLKYKLWNPFMVRLTGYTSEEVVGKYPWELFPFLEQYGVIKNLKNALNGEVLKENDFEFYIPRNGFSSWVSDRTTHLYNSKGELIGLIATIRDITERKKAEMEIRDSERQIRMITNNIPAYISYVDSNLHYRYVNENYERLCGLNNEEIIGKHIREVLGEEYMVSNLENILKVLGGEKVYYENAIETKMGEHLYVSVSCIPHLDNNGNVAGYYVFSNDITERKRAEEEILKAKEQAEESETKFRSYVENAPDGIIVFNNNGDIQDANFEIVKMFGYSLEELKQFKKPIFAVESDYPKVSNAVAELFSKGRCVEEYHMVRKDGSTFWGIMSSVRFSDRQVLSFIKDITKIKEVELELIASKDKAEMNELKLKEAQEIARLGSWELDIETGIFTFTDSFYKIFHTSAEEIGGYQMTINEYSQRFLHPDDAFIVAEESQKAIDTYDHNFSRYLEHRILYKDGSTGFIAVRFFVVKDKNGKTVKTYGVNQDITERRLAEEALAKSEERFQKVAESAEEWFWEVDANGLYTYSNNVVEKILGFKADEVVGRKHFFDFFEPAEKDILKKNAFKIFELKERFKDFINLNIHKNGDKVILRTSGSPILNSNGNLVGYRGVDADITREKEIEKALRDSEERFRLSFKTSPDSVNINALDGTYIEINEGFTELTGYTEQDVIGKSSIEINIWKNPSDRQKLIDGLMKDGICNNLEAEFRLKDGSVKTALMSARIINIDGKPHILSITRDISERKKFEDSLKTLSWAVEQSPASIVITDTKGCIEFINKKFIEVTGYSFNEAIGSNPSILKSGLTSEEEYKLLWETILSGNEWQGEFCNIKKNGEKYWERALISPITNEKGEIMHFVAVKEDITEKREMDRKMLSYIVDAEERERNRFSQELHDGLGPILSTVKLYFQWLHETNDEVKKKMIFDNGVENLNDAINSIREISNNLSPRTISTFGVNAALKNFISNINQTQKFKIDYNANIDNRYDKNIEIIIYRIITELINNTIKYAKASKVDINLSDNGQIVKLLYSDDGRGFCYEKVEKQGKGIGLFNIIQRVKTLDGTIKIDSALGKGVSIAIEIPIENSKLH